MTNMSFVTSFLRNVTRKKTVPAEEIQSDLKRCLSLFDLIFLAIGSMIGSGLYVLTGTVSRDVAGPSVIISYVLAAVASGLSAICYAEFAARVPVTGSAYQFIYLSIGEIWAFLIGWNVLIEHAGVGSTIAKSFSGYLDSLLDNAVQNYLTEHVPLPGGILAEYPDFMAAGFLLFITCFVVSGVKISSTIAAFFAVLNLIVIIIIAGSGFYLGSIENWTSVRGGFFPNGVSGTLGGAATLIFSYVGYEVIATSTEESLKPDRDVPLSLVVSISSVVLAYVGASASLTLMIPWFEISEIAPFPEAFAFYGWTWARYLVSVGALAAMVTSALASQLIVTRYLYAMARDGLLFKYFAQVSSKTKVPIISSLATSVVCIVFAVIFPISTLVELISIGQLLATMFVAFCVIKLRYQANTIASYRKLSEDEEETSVQSSTSERFEMIETSQINQRTSHRTYETLSDIAEENHTEKPEIGSIKLKLLKGCLRPLLLPLTKIGADILPFHTLLLSSLCTLLVVVIFTFAGSNLSTWWCILFLISFTFLAVVSLVFLTFFEQDPSFKTFKVPLVPFIPFASIVINLILLLNLSSTTWIRLGIWLLLGFLIYFGYGYRNSKERSDD